MHHRQPSVQKQVKALTERSLQQGSSIAALQHLTANAGQLERLSLFVFSGSLDRLIAAFVLATGAAAIGMQVSMFFYILGHGFVAQRRGLREQDIT